MNDTTSEMEQWFENNSAEFESVVDVGNMNTLWAWLMEAFQMGYKKGLGK